MTFGRRVAVQLMGIALVGWIAGAALTMSPWDLFYAAVGVALAGLLLELMTPPAFSLVPAGAARCHATADPERGIHLVCVLEHDHAEVWHIDRTGIPWTEREQVSA